MTSRFQNCLWLLYFVDNSQRYSKLKTLTKILNDTVNFSCAVLVFSFIWVDTKFSRFYKTASKSKIWSIHKMIKSSRDELKFQIYRPHQAGSKFQFKWVLHAYGTLLQSTLRVPDNAQPNHVIPIFGEIQNFVFWGPQKSHFFGGMGGVMLLKLWDLGNSFGDIQG